MKFKKYLKVLVLTVPFILLSGFKTYSQQVYATTATEVSEGNRVDNVQDAAADNGLFATVNSNGGLILGVGAFSGELKLEFSSLVQANTTTYIKVDDGGKGLFDSLLGGSLGELLSDVAGTLVFGDHYVEVSALDSSEASVASGRTDNLNSSETLKVVINKDGDYFIAITPTVAYKAVVIKDVTDALLLGEENFVNVHHAFYLEPSASFCDSQGIFTSFDGTGITLGLLEDTGLLGVTGVDNPEFAIDLDDTTHSSINVGVVSALATIYQDIEFSTTSSITDNLEINIRPKEGSLVNVAILQNITIELFNKEELVFSIDADAAGEIAIQPDEDGEITKIKLAPEVEFDRLRLTLESPLGVSLAQQVDLFSTKVISLNPSTPTTTNLNQIFCSIDAPTIANLEATATSTIIWYDQATGGIAFAPTDALEDGLKYYAANSNGTCESNERLEVSVTVQNPSVPTTTNANQVFCTINVPTIANIEATATGTIIWYNLPTGGNAYTISDTLVDGLKYYAANFNGTCESGDRLEVTVTIINPITPTTAIASQSFCPDDTPTIANLEAIATNTIVWYDQATGGNAYATTDVLVDGLKYYAANSDGTCESSTRLEITVIIQNPLTPKTANISQNFCITISATIANLKATASGTIIWYNQTTGGNAYATTDTLEDGVKYYAANLVGTCESSERLEVTVAIQNPTTPTTNNANQSFCAIDSPTIANLEASATGTIIWYDQATGGNAYANTDALEDGLKYYAVNSDGTCESSDRLEVTVAIQNPSTPTTTNTNQVFCDVDAPTITNLEATATGTVIWYDQPTEGSAYASSDALKDGLNYYAANSDGNCESSERLEVAVTVTTGSDLTIQGNNTDVCFGTVETYEVPAGRAPYTWNITGGNIISGGTTTDNSIEIEWTNLSDTKVSVTLTGGCFNDNSVEQVVGITTCSDLTIKKEVDLIKPNIDDTIVFTIAVENSALSIFTDINVSEVLTDGFIYVSNTTTLGSYNESSGIWNIPTLGANESATLTIKAKIHTTGDYLNTASIITSSPEDADTSNNTVELLVTPSCLKIFNNMTPNGDGINDHFVISCIDQYSNSELEIFDRYGSVIYKTKNYKNDWTGIANQTSKIIRSGQQLPNGTYFFVLKLNDGSTEVKKNYIQIKK